MYSIVLIYTVLLLPNLDSDFSFTKKQIASEEVYYYYLFKTVSEVEFIHIKFILIFLT